MDFHDSRKVLVAFLASPGDVVEERRIAREAVDRANKILEAIGWQIDLRGWEDTLPGHGRPQALINDDVRACQLFIGLLWAHWGSPTGEYSSGFEEEYRLALKLSEQHGGPEIWLFFKKVPDAQLKDAGKHLKKVLDFRKKVVEKREVLFKDLNSTEEWENILFVWLIKYVLKLDERTRLRPAGALTGPTPATEPPRVSSAEKKDEKPPVPRQLSEALAAGAVHAGSPTELGAFQAARLHLFATTALARYTNPRLGTHEINLLYLHREKLEVTPKERVLLLQTTVSDGDHVTPGWYWFTADDSEMIRCRLLSLATRSGDVQVRIRATALLMESEMQPDGWTGSALTRADVVSNLLDDGSAEARRVKIDYLSKVGSLADLIAIGPLIIDQDGQVRSKAQEAHAMILARNDPGRMLAEVIAQRQVLQKSVASELARQATQLDDAALMAAADHPDPVVRSFAARQLDARGAITTELAHKFSKDPSDGVKVVGCGELLRVGVELEEIAPLVQQAIKPRLVGIMAKQPVDALMCQLDMYSPDGTVVYEALAQYHFDDFAGRIRSDLKDGFDSIDFIRNSNTMRL